MHLSDAVGRLRARVQLKTLSSLLKFEKCVKYANEITDDMIEGLNGVNRLATKSVKYYQLPTKRGKNYRLTTKKYHRQPAWSDVIGMFVFQKHRILNIFLGQEVSRSFAGLHFTRRNDIKSRFSQL